jgi:mRNA interferase HigB
MHVISRKRLREFGGIHSKAQESLQKWYVTVRHATWKSFAVIRETFNSVDLYQRCYVCNVSGNKYRIIAAVHYNIGKVYIRKVLTHAEYDKGKWKPDCAAD